MPELKRRDAMRRPERPAPKVPEHDATRRPERPAPKVPEHKDMSRIEALHNQEKTQAPGNSSNTVTDFTRHRTERNDQGPSASVDSSSRTMHQQNREARRVAPLLTSHFPRIEDVRHAEVTAATNPTKHNKMMSHIYREAREDLGRR